jgi:hypothetical protein
MKQVLWKPVLWFRISAVLFLFFAVGHTFGFLTFQPPSAEGRAVWSAMNNVRFSAGGSTFSYGGFYLGFGLSITASQLFSAWLAWFLGSMARRGVESTRSIAWAMVLLQVVGFGLSLRFFSWAPATLSAVSAACLSMAAWSMRRSTVPAAVA